MKCLFWFVVSCLSVAYASAADFHVSPDGSDENPATATAPVKSLEKARDLARAARKARPDAPMQILLHPGIYTIRRTVEFTTEDSAAESAPLTIKAWKDPKSPNDWPKLVGGVVVSDWKKSDFDNKTLSSAGGQIFEADLKPLDINGKFRQIYLNGRRQIWARYPNYDPALPYSGGWAYVDGNRPPMYTDIEGERTDTVVMRAKDQRNWSRPTDGEVCIFPRYNWWNRIEKIRQFDPATRTITLGKEDAVRRPAGRSLRRVRHEGRTRCTGRVVPGRRRSEALLHPAAIAGESGGYRPDGRDDFELHKCIECHRSRTGIQLCGGSGH